MDKVTRYHWQGNSIILTILCLPLITIPIACVYFVSQILKIETEVPDGEQLAEYLSCRG